MLYKTKFWIILFSVLLLVSAGAFLLLKSSGEAGARAEIWSDGELIETIDLAAVTIPYDIEVATRYGTNTVHIAHGAVSVTDADCPDQVCVRQGEITDGAIPIICMPHRLVIEIEAEP